MNWRRAATLISAMPAKLVAEAAKELLQRDEHITMGRFVGVLPDESLRAAAPVMGDADLLRMKSTIETGRPPHDAARPLPRES